MTVVNIAAEDVSNIVYMGLVVAALHHFLQSFRVNGSLLQMVE